MKDDDACKVHKGNTATRCRDCVEKVEAEARALRDVLRAMISTGNLTPSLQCMAMNALEPGSGQAWLDRLDAQQHHPECAWLEGEDASLCSCAGRGRVTATGSRGGEP